MNEGRQEADEQAPRQESTAPPWLLPPGAPAPRGHPAGGLDAAPSEDGRRPATAPPRQGPAAWVPAASSVPGGSPATHEPPTTSSSPPPAGSGAPPAQPAGPPPPWLSPSAAEFTPERMLRPRATAPETGWRRFLFRASGGLVKPAPSSAELRQRELIGAVKTPLLGCRRVAVLSRKGGIGKTTTTLMLGHTFASHRGDRVLAVDANPDAGSLASRVRRETRATVTELLRDSARVVRYSDVRAYTSQAPSRLEVLASDDDPTITVALAADDYSTVFEVLEKHYNLLIVDTGTGILDSATQGIIRMADQLVICAASGLDASRTAALTLDWLDKHGYQDKVRQAVVAINAVRGGGLVELDHVARHFARRCRAVVRVPFDRALEAGAETDLDELADDTQDAYLELAAQVAAGFTHASVAQPYRAAG